MCDDDNIVIQLMWRRYYFRFALLIASRCRLTLSKLSRFIIFFIFVIENHLMGFRSYPLVLCESQFTKLTNKKRKKSENKS